ncbi:MAG: type I-U CRISPR-associated helicase/endonuclease Cas3 [Vicinamibacteria bacterium]|nr:type I-U CRISPR-associated helicase/endonuclease Cas3 [Vicinamibacteria bacterium]
MTLTPAAFDAFHAAVHDGRRPFAWQQRLLERLVAERRWPQVLDLPTGSGKTTCLDVALFALALDAAQAAEDRWCPRRIVMVVDRRIVVDQVAERGRVLLRALTTSSDPAVVEVSRRLRSLTRAGEAPLGVFTLRGGIPKDDGWARTPDQPLIIASTVDQVGSRMLIQGYGVSRGMKPVHAGLLANDTLLLLDEVHLSEPFRQTLEQLARLRQRFSERGVRTRFVHAFLSATPAASTEPPFALLEPEKAPTSPLGPRLHASKPARLVEVDDRACLEKACVEQATALLRRHRTVAVVTNRVASASEITGRLSAALGADATVTLLTGRMRPLDRDDVLRELAPAVRAGRARSGDEPKRIIVGTQCLEAGADFDFDALVTESASLDSLRQRFGRVDRLGAYMKSESVIVHAKDGKDDPIYGDAINETVKWLKKKLTKKRPFVDFGILALEVPRGEELAPLLAPKANAPTLLPAYLDLWAQTAPEPSQVPDVSLWLHGPKSGPADVQVVWRADLSEELLQKGDAELATAIVAAVRPSSLEALSLPFPTARAWLAGQKSRDLGDTEGAPLEDDDLVGGRLPPRDQAGPGADRRALRWRGAESDLVDATTLRPGDSIVVPAAYGGIRNRCFDGSFADPVMDRAEQASLVTRARPVLRLHRTVIDGLGLELPLDEPAEARAALGRITGGVEWPAWMRLWAQRLAQGFGSLVVPGDPGWTVLEAKRVPLAELQRVLQADDTWEDGVELTTDDDDSYHAGRSVSLSRHSADVEAFAREYAMRCGLGPWLADHVALAAWLHDIGKVDRRFQLMLRGGSEIDFFKDETPWAKSAMSPGARAAHRLAQGRSGYPRGARHEVQSLAMAEARLEDWTDFLKKRDPGRAPDSDLVLHLVASHHGHCRPFAPVVLDREPVDVSLPQHTSAAFGAIDFPPMTSNHGLHRLDAALGDRFWRLVERYGWQELCWLEAILRLADHRASEEEQMGEAAS